MKRAAAILRRSRDIELGSIKQQQEQIERYATENGFVVVQWFTEDGVSGALASGRDVFQQMMQAAKKPKADRDFDAILAYDMSRFSRGDVYEGAHHIYELRNAGVEVKFVAEDTPLEGSGQIVFAARQFQKNELLKQVSRDSIRGLVPLAKLGLWCGGPPPYGFDLLIVEKSTGKELRVLRLIRRGRRLPEGGRVPSIHEEYNIEGKLLRRIDGSTDGYVQLKMTSEASRLRQGDPARVELVRRIFNLYVKDGTGFRRIADTLNIGGVPSASGGKWVCSAVREILLNPVYKGVLVWNERTEAIYHSVCSGKAQERPWQDRQKVRLNPEAQQIRREAAELAIVPAELWDAAQTRMKTRNLGRDNQHSLRSEYALSGLVVCGNCGRKMCGSRSKRRKQTSQGVREHVYARYVCSTYSNQGRSQCGFNVAPADPLEDFVLRKIREDWLEYGDPSDLRARVEKILRSRISQPARDSSAAQKELRSIEGRLEALERVSSTDLSVLGLAGQGEQLQARRTQLLAELGGNKTRPGRTVDAKEAAGKAVELLADFQKYESLPLERKRELFRRYGARVSLRFEERLVAGRRRSVLKGGRLEMFTLADVAGQGAAPDSCVSEPTPATNAY